MITPIGTAQLGPFVSLQFTDENAAKAFVRELNLVTKYDGAPLPDENGIISKGNIEIDLTDAETIYVDNSLNVMVRDADAYFHNLHTFRHKGTARGYARMLAKFNTNMQEITENVRADTTAIDLIYVDETPEAYKVRMVLKDNFEIKLKEFGDPFSAVDFKNKIDEKR